MPSSSTGSATAAIVFGNAWYRNLADQRAPTSSIHTATSHPTNLLALSRCIGGSFILSRRRKAATMDPQDTIAKPVVSTTAFPLV